MRDFRTVTIWQRIKRAGLSLDSAIDAGLYDSWQRSKANYERFVTFMDRFHVRGWKKLFVNLACDGLTMGLGGLLILATLAQPAFVLADNPNWLRQQDLAVTFLDRHGQEIGKRGIRRDDSVRLEDYPDFVVQALLATEDRRFYEHFGIDIVGLSRAIVTNARAGGTVQGGSSLTQQLAKNLFLNNERSIERKIKEAFLALWLETHLKKREILQLYLDRAYMGGGNFGIQAAAEYYFGKNIKDVTLAEAAMLAGLFKAPTKYAPHVNLPAARARANDVLSNLVDAGFMTEAQVFGARQNPATAIERKRDSSPDYFLDWAFEDIKRVSDAGTFGDNRVLVVKTGFDPAIQSTAQQAIESMLRQYGKQYDVSQAATVIMDLDGSVRAIVGGRDYGASQFNRATDGKRQPGSSFKPYVYVTALLSGKFKPTTTVVDRPVCIGNWCPGNYSKGHYAGAVPLWMALAKSLNTIPVQLATAIGDGNNKAGRAKIMETLKKVGVQTPVVDQVSLPIGSAELTVMDQVQGYSVFANAGKRVTPHAGVEVRSARNEVIYRYDRDAPPAPQVIPASVAQDMDFMMNKVTEEGTAKRALLDGVPTAGKTGTTNDYRDAWFVGFTGNMIGAVWYGNDDSSGMAGLTGGILPAMTWHEIMKVGHRGIDIKPIPGVEHQPDPALMAQEASKSADKNGFQPIVPLRPTVLSKRSGEALAAIGAAFRDRPTALAPIRPLTMSEPQGATRAVGGRIATQ